MQVTARCLLLATVSMYAGNLVCSREAARLKTFASPAHHFQVAFPSTWFEYSDTDATAGILYITSFPPQRRAEGVFIPRGGAEIVFRPAQCSGLAARDWARSVTRGGEVISRGPVALNNPGGVNATGTRIVLRVELGPNAFLRQTAVCLLVGDVSFQARLAYWEGDKAAPEYLQVLETVLRSLKSTL
jgi:hypothetical protein